MLQSLEVIKLIKSQMPIERAHMRIKITASKDGRKLKEKLSKLCTSIENEEWEGSTLILVSKFILICCRSLVKLIIWKQISKIV